MLTTGSPSSVTSLEDVAVQVGLSLRRLEGVDATSLDTRSGGCAREALGCLGPPLRDPSEPRC